MFCVDEKTAIQALDRKDRMLPLSPWRAESHGFEYKRHGTLSLFAALNTAIGEVLGKTAPRRTSEQFVAFLTQIVASQPERREIHVICDNASSHKTKRVEDFLAAHRNVQMHFTPTYSSWLNQVENRFSRIQRDVISRGIFTSVKDLSRKLMRYIREHNNDPKPIKHQTEVRRSIAANSAGANSLTQWTSYSTSGDWQISRTLDPGRRETSFRLGWGRGRTVQPVDDPEFLGA